jgi:hypothetical protein
MKRRGLNFITDHHEMNLDMESINTIEQEVDNVAPKIIGILPLGASCDTSTLRSQMVDYCIDYMQNQMPKKSQELNIDRDLPFQAFICPNAGASSNMSSRKQRLIFLEIDRDDVYSILDVGKVADLILVTMSCKETETQNLKQNPDECSKAIDELGYKALGLLRS